MVLLLKVLKVLKVLLLKNTFLNLVSIHSECESIVVKERPLSVDASYMHGEMNAGVDLSSD